MVSKFTDPSELPHRSQPKPEFDRKMGNYFRDLPGYIAELHALADGVGAAVNRVNALAAGGAYALPYIFETATADAAPTAGRLRLSTATQNAATVMRIDLFAAGQDVRAQIATFAAATSVVKGAIKLVKQGDASKWMTFNLTGVATPAGYRNLSVVCTDSSSASPFANGDALMLFFQRTGDKGDDAVGALQLLSSVTVSSAVAQIDFLNIFSAAYDKYIIELQNITPATQGILRARLAVGGVVDSSALYNFPSANGGQGAAVSALDLYSANGTYATMTLEVRNTNGASMTAIGARGAYYSTVGTPGPYSVVVEGAYRGTSAVSGFRLYFSSGNISAGIVRVYGIKNNS